MKTRLAVIAFAFVFVFAPSLCAQTWQWQNPAPSGNAIYDMAFADSMVGWVVGSYGTVLKTTDGGVTWAQQNAGTPARFETVACAGPNCVWAAGYNWLTRRGTIARSTDGGLTWTRQIAFPYIWFHHMVFTDSLNGWLAGTGEILHTVNAGQDWQVQYSNGNMEFYGISAVSGQIAWTVGYDYVSNAGVILHTSNGTNWSYQFSNSLGHLWSVSFANADSGWIVGLDRNILNTTDGGATWAEQISETVFPRCVQFLNGRTGWIACNGGIVLHTADAGIAWDTLTISTNSYPNGLRFLSPQRGFVCGSGGTLFRTADGGQNWIRRGTGTEAYLNAVSFADTINGWAVGGYNTILHTANGGTGWTPQSSGLPYGYWTGVCFADALAGWICGVGGAGTILSTEDGGSSWHAQVSDVQAVLYQITFCDSFNGWAVGEGGTILHTSNGGTTWEQQTSPQTLTLWAVTSTDPWHAWAVCHQESGQYNGYVLHTTDSGDNWEIQATLTYGYVYGITMRDSANGWVVGASAQTGTAAIWNTTDGGQTWNPLATGYPTILLAVKSAGQTVLATSSDGMILRWTEGGLMWRADTTGTDNQLWGLAMAGPDHAWAVGDGGTILRSTTTPSAVVDRESALPQRFSLAAYPNPFNPVSTLELTLSRTEHVRIAIYDLTGRLVMLLADRVFAAGTRHITFDGSRLSSGVYFARAESGDLTRTQRLLLLK